MKEHKILKYFILGLLGLFIVHQVYSSLYKPISTESAQYYVAVDGVKAEGTVIRNETLVSGAGEGVLHFLTPSGSHVAKSGVIAQVYDSAATSYTVNRISELNKRISDIEQLMAYNSVTAADMGAANARVKESLSAVITASRGGNISSARFCSDKLLFDLNRRRMITGEETDFSAKLEALKGELAALSETLPQVKSSVTAPVSGYFISGVDGFETVFSNKTAAELTPEFINNAKAEEVPAGTVGKIVSDYEWFVCCKVSVNDSLKFKEDEELTLVASSATTQELKATVKAINLAGDSNSAVVVLSCSSLSKELASMRNGKFTIISKTYTGLKVPKKSLRIVNKQSGVYILTGSVIKFVPVNVLYTVDDYVVCEQKKETGNILHLYDEVVVKGKKLYDGKAVG